MLKREDLIYLAGVFDGEGYVGIERSKPPLGAKSVRYKLRVAITMADPLVPGMCYREFGGYCALERMQNPKWRDRWAWSVASNMAAKFLETLTPYLRIKSNQALLGLKFHATKWSGRNRGWGHSKPSVTEIRRRERFYDRMRKLKKIPVGSIPRPFHRAPKPDQECPECGVTFCVVGRRNPKGAPATYCSKSCRQVSINRRQKERRAAAFRTIEHKCPVCKVRFVPETACNMARQKYCSRKCSNLHWNARKRPTV